MENVNKITLFIFFQAGMVTNPAIWLVLSAVRIFLSLTTVTVTLAWVFFHVFVLVWGLGKLNKLFTGLGSVHIAKNCDLGLENFQPWSQFFTIWTSQLANNIYNITWVICHHMHTGKTYHDYRNNMTRIIYFLGHLN